MKKTQLFVFLLALLPMVVNAQADQKLINKAQQGDAKAMVTLAKCYENGAGVVHDSTLAVKWFQKAADAGNNEAVLYLTYYSLHGTRGYAKDTAACFAKRKSLAEAGDANAMAALGVCYEDGLGCKADTAKALELYVQSAKKGSAIGLRYMGDVYYYGFGEVKKDEKQGLSYYEKALKAGEYMVCSRLARHYVSGKDFKKAWKYINQGIAWADPNVWTLLAEMNYTGYGVDENEARAIQILDSLIAEHHNLSYGQMLAGVYRLNAENSALRDTASALRILQEGDQLMNSARCQMQLASYYFGKEKFEDSYRYALKTVGNNGNKDFQGGACYLLAVMYLEGYGVAVDKDQYVEWMKRGCDEFENVKCAKDLAYHYLEVSEDVPQAVKYFRLADKYGDAEALAELGQLYAKNGNMELAAACFQQIIDKGDPDGYYYLGLLYDQQGDAKTCNKYLAQGDKKGSKYCSGSLGSIYEFGLDGVKIDNKKAAAYYQKSATPKSLYRLGLMYLDGKVGKQKEEDVTKGLDYVSEAAQSGLVEARYALGCFYETGEYVGNVDHAKAISYFKPLADQDVAAGQFKMGLYNELGDGGLEVDSAKAIEYYQLAADQNHALAMCYLGDFYRIGRYLPLDQKKAFALYMQAHELGEEGGTYYVGRSYLEGCGVEVDTAMAVPYLKEATRMGVGNAAYHMAELYNYGRGGVEVNGDSALYYYIQGHKYGNGECSYKVGAQLIAEGAYEMGVECLRTATNRGSADGAYLLALCLKEGVGVKEPMPKDAHRLFEAVVRVKDHPGAYYQLGVVTIQGLGCPNDENLGKAYLDTAANLGDVEAMYSLGQCYLNGIGCNVDTNTAIFWLEKSADNAKIQAINKLGDVYQAQGDFKNSVLYYEKGVAAGSLESYCNMGYCYEQGLGVVLNSQKAYEMYKFAADHQYATGYRLVAHCYLDGIYVEENAAEALAWLTKAAEAGDVLSMYYCGAILEEGAEGVKADVKKAREWYKKAATAGYEPAAAALARMK